MMMKDMKKTSIAALILLTFFLIMAGFNIVRAQNNSDIIKSPVNHSNYATNLLTLKITFTTVFSPDSKNFGSDEYYYITYCIDGKENTRIPKESISYEISHGILIPNNLTATVALPLLNDGYHTFTVNAREPYIIPGQTGYYYHQDTIDFTVKTQPTPTLTAIPNLTPTPSPSPSPNATPIPTLEPTLEPTQTPIPTLEPTLEPTPTPITNLYSDWIPIAVIALAPVIGVGALVYFKKRKRS